jgi:hypothetical protein
VIALVCRCHARAKLALAVVLLPVTAAAQGGVAQRSSWFASLSGEQGWDNNVRYEADSSRISDQNRRLTATANITRVRARTTFALSSTGSVVRYQTLKALNVVSYDVNLGATRRLTAHTAGSAGAFYRNVLSSEVVTTPTTLLFQRALQKSVGGNAGLTRKFSAFNGAAFDVSYSSVKFDRPGLVPGSSWSGRGQFAHALRRRGTIGVVVDFSQGDAQGVQLGTQSLSALVLPKLGKLSISVIAGATRTVTDSSATFLPSGSVQVGDSIGPGSLSAGYSRGSSQAFGLGALLISDAVSLAYDFQARRGNFVTLGGWWGNSRTSAGPARSLQSRAAFASFRRVLKAGITVGGSASYRHRKDLIQASGLSAQIGLGMALRPR